jgi:hypothetical protein
MIWIIILIGAVVLLSSMKSTSPGMGTPVSANIITPVLYDTAAEVAAATGSMPPEILQNAPAGYGADWSKKAYIYVGPGLPPQNNLDGTPMWTIPF